jgi:hypothetical protein
MTISSSPRGIQASDQTFRFRQFTQDKRPFFSDPCGLLSNDCPLVICASPSIGVSIVSEVGAWSVYADCTEIRGRYEATHRTIAVTIAFGSQLSEIFDNLLMQTRSLCKPRQALFCQLGNRANTAERAISQNTAKRDGLRSASLAELPYGHQKRWNNWKQEAFVISRAVQIEATIRKYKDKVNIE